MEVIAQLLATIQVFDERLLKKHPEQVLLQLAAQTIMQQHPLIVDFAAKNRAQDGIHLWGFQAERQDLIARAGAGNFQAQVLAPRNVYSAQKPDQILNLLAITGLLTSPVARLLAELLDVKLHFTAMRGKPKGIILPG